MTPDDRVRWGILGPGMIARNAIMPAFAQAANSRVVAVASREQARAQTFADDFGIPAAYGDYQALIDDPAVEAIYIALPNDGHPVWTICAAEAGKAVLCEKPLAVTPAEAVAMVEAARAHHTLLMEAVMYRFHPRMQALVERVQRGEIGDPRLVRSSFCFTLSDPTNYRNDPAMGGGALLDVGSYTVNIARWLLGEPVLALAQGTLAATGSDLTVSGVLTFASGALAQVQCSFASAEHQHLDVTGTTGVFDVPAPFTGFAGPDCVITLQHNRDRATTPYEAANPYALMVEHFGECLRGRAAPFMAAEDGIGTMRALAALQRSLASGRAEAV